MPTNLSQTIKETDVSTLTQKNITLFWFCRSPYSYLALQRLQASSESTGHVVAPTIFRLQTGYYADIIAQAASLMENLAINHPFVDDNKRIAFAAADVFLRINGWRLKRQPLIIHTEMLEMFESGTFDIAHLEPWLRTFALADS